MKAPFLSLSDNASNLRRASVDHGWWVIGVVS